MKKRFTFLIAALMLLVFMTPSMVGWGQTRTEVTDNMTASNLAATGTTYTDFSNVTITSDAVYAGQSAKDGSGNIQLRSKNSNSGIVTTTSGGTISSINITVGSGSNTIDVYGSNTAYTAASDLYNSSTRGTKIGSLSSTGTINVDDSYAYVGIRSNSGAVYISSIDFVWTTGGGSYTITAQSNNSTYGTVSLSGNVITGSPNSGYRYASPAYTVTSGTATVSQSINDFTVTPSSDCTVTINFEAIPTHTATFSVNGATSSQNYLEGASIEFPDDPANISGRKFVGWVTTPIAVPTDDEPSFVNTTSTTMSSGDVTFYAVFAIATPGDPVETKTQTLQYDTWTYSGSTTDKTTYRLFHTNSYIESAAFDLSKLTKVIVYGGTFGGDSYNSLTIGDGTNTWKNVTVTGKSETGVNTYTDGTALTGTKALRVTSNSGMASSTGVRISKVEIFTREPSYTYSGYCTSVVVYTITAVSNNTEYGNVTLSGEVITGSPKSGYRYASPAYTVSPANSAIVVQDGNEFTVTPSANTTVTINFELIPTYTLSYVVSPAGAGTVTLGASSGLLEGATTTATALANAGKKFTSWSISGTGASLSNTTDNPVTVTMGAENAIVTANFDDVPTNAITYSVNGVTNIVNVEENTTVDLSAPTSALIPVGYVFKGWRTSTVALTDTDPGGYVTSATSTGPTTYYAVWAVRKSFSPDTYEQLTSNSFNTNDTYLIGATQGGSGGDGETMMYLLSYSSTDEEIAWGTCTSAPATNSPIKFNLSGSASSLVAKDNSGNYLTCIAAKKFAMSSTSTTVYLDSDGSILSESEGNLLRYNHNNGNGGLRWYASTTGSQAYFYKVVDNCTYGSFCTTVSSISLTENVTISGDLNVNNYVLTIPTGKTLTVTGTLTNTTPANLVIEDGGQLVTTSSNVQATFEKTIATSTNDDAHWYTISSPVTNTVSPADPGATITSVSNLVNNNVNYNLYRYVENAATNQWESYNPNIHNDFVALLNGHGYLYRNNGQSLTFTGKVNVGNVEVPVTAASSNNGIKGFNLLGNPYSHDITLKHVKTDEDEYFYNCYILSGEGSWTAGTLYDGETSIKPCQGFFVQADESATATISKNTQRGINANGDFIKFTVANNEYKDVAYAIFDKGQDLTKINHRNAKIQQIYIPKDGENFAVATMADNIQSFNLNFKAMTMGQYTLGFKAKGEFNYLHVIDRMTGNDIDMLLEGEYSFIGSPQDNEARFIVRLGYLPNYDNNGEGIFAYQNGNNIIVSGEGELQIFDVMGRMVSTQNVSGTETISVNAQGVYIFRLVGTEIKTQKIVVK